TKGKATIRCFRSWAKSETSNAAPLNVAIDSAGCSNTTGAPHEYFYQTGIRKKFFQAGTGLTTPRSGA
ncbi:MAG TPA: hypothetical protein VGR73_13285, partial [Bryobacteraceae bacterium]|nr:hypothetical protein [Bryobacteraceae bacterium]